MELSARFGRRSRSTTSCGRMKTSLIRLSTSAKTRWEKVGGQSGRLSVALAKGVGRTLLSAAFDFGFAGFGQSRSRTNRMHDHLQEQSQNQLQNQLQNQRQKRR